MAAVFDNERAAVKAANVRKGLVQDVGLLDELGRRFLDVVGRAEHVLDLLVRHRATQPVRAQEERVPDFRRLEGVISREDVLEKYQMADME